LPQINLSGSLDDNVALPKLVLPGEIIGQPGEQIPVEMGTQYVLDASARLEQVIFSPTFFAGIKNAGTVRSGQSRAGGDTSRRHG
jgi:hypothetical protein